MSNASKVVPADTKTVRAFFLANPTLVPDGDKTVGPKSAGKGRVSKDAKTIFAEHNPGTEFFERKVGQATKTVDLKYVHVQPSGRKVTKTVTLPTSEVRDLVPGAPRIGKMSQALLTAAGEAYAANLAPKAPTKPKAAAPVESTETE